MSEPIIDNNTLAVNNESIPQPENQDNVIPSGITHGFDTAYAIAYGVDEALMIRNLQFFITANANRGNNLKDGRYWTYDRLEDFPKHFPYWSIKQIRRIITSLIEQDIIIKDEHNDKWSNRTQWYAFKDQEKFIKNIYPPMEKKQSSSDLPKRATESCPNGQLTDAHLGNCYNDTSSIPSAISSSSSLIVPKVPKAAKAAEKKKDFNPNVEEIGQQMIERLVSIKPDYVPPKNLVPLFTEVDFILRLDKRDAQKVLDVFAWALADSFWADKMFKPNPAKYLREKFDQLDMKMNAKPPANPNQVDRRLRDEDGKTVDDYKDRLF